MIGGVMGRFPSRWQEEIHQGSSFHIAHLIIGDFLAHRDRQRFG